MIQAEGSEKAQEIMEEEVCRECWATLEKTENTNQERTHDEPNKSDDTETKSGSDVQTAEGSEKAQETQKERLCQECWTSHEKAKKIKQELIHDEFDESEDTSDSYDEMLQRIEDFL